MSLFRRVKDRSPSSLSLRHRSLRVEPLDPRRMLANMFHMDPSTVTAESIGYTLAPEASPEVAQAVASAAASGSANAEVAAPFAPDQLYSVNPEDRIVAYIDMGGSPQSRPECRKLALNLCDNGWAWVLENWYQPMVDAGVTRMLISTPFGQRAPTDSPNAAFQFDAYLTAHSLDPEVGVPNQNATRDFVPAWQDFFADNRANGVDVDAIAYIGSPRHDGDQLALIPTPSAWWDRAYDIILPLLRAGFRSIGFDAGARAPIDSFDQQLFTVLRNPSARDPVRDARLINLLGDEPIEVYIEAVPTVDTGQTDLPLAVLDRDFVFQNPERPGGNPIFYEHDRFTGEIIRLLRNEQWDEEGEGALVSENILQSGHSVGGAFQFLLRSTNNGATPTVTPTAPTNIDMTLDGFIDQMLLPSLPTLIDLDPNDVNPEGTLYSWDVDPLRSPEHGQLTENRWYGGEVLTYTPDHEFVGQDSFTYAVENPVTGEVSFGEVNLYVNVPPPDDDDGGGGRDSGRRRRGDRRSRDD